ncbi:DUF2231 domain-containing protein [Halomonas urumqiensis]|uniref:DUF2231 domain-containing protein n=1 Tax=Halomonas urumqiensis TaxID=1684789 RepID=A0A2N7UFX2_9GAMM|nr:DUF2231 domain-containing protein [Halomonas urumqiensis]PMR79324.1 hypothetical protein C1H70_13090 [Halomonas urumqiensis]PTB04341.1 DUF2231 domain-containing protein [Halomonas urumqiensis]GHE19857.1 hypothetical protein GCM10017767_03780 [Halomonas urumqiensis]
MPKPLQRSIRSRAAFAGHPLHPVMIHFPVAALLGLVASDLGFLYTGDPFWTRASMWLAGVGAIGGWLASLAGIVDLVTVRGIRRLVTAWTHAMVAVVMLSMASLNWLWRLLDEALLPWGLTLSLSTAAMIALAGWLGGQLVYEHAVGVELDD